MALRSTGDLSDATEAQHLTEMLTANFERIGPWRLIESYCATDPCDPEAARPENIRTLRRNTEIWPLIRLL